MSIFNEFISRESKKYRFQVGRTLASSLFGFICGAIFASIVWYTLIVWAAGTASAQTNPRLQEFREKAQLRAEQAKTNIEAKRQEAERRIAEARATAKERISEIRDTKKQEAANKIVAQLARINKVATEHFSNVLDRLDDILQKIKSRMEKTGEDGPVPATVLSAISAAELKIAAARTAVEAQAQKTYALDAAGLADGNDQDALVASMRTQFARLRQQLRNDLDALRNGAVAEARDGVRAALDALQAIKKANETNTNEQ